jgi:hypothetical protein
MKSATFGCARRGTKRRRCSDRLPDDALKIVARGLRRKIGRRRVIGGGHRVVAQAGNIQDAIVLADGFFPRSALEQTFALAL